MIIVLATIESTIEDINNLHQAIVDMQTATTEAEPGNIAYTFTTDVTNPGTIRVIEQWQSMDALKEHMAAPHMATFQKAMAGYPPKSMDVKINEIAQELPLSAM
ncbi:MAG: antibiotic biosynthesis monooxygenase [Oceanicoccus sp.]|uniref:putative quinol monooxygenase n=1 Tax=Oceanicoccus sp. TaxID=2691044 RepID=UPI0026180D97|nr:putative quinol monooxygenase [Oceanicoccus sp.]MCP3909186.1 antibiotic biosynthesis monooxygenase [Oceanicoccus sp.]